MIPAPCFESQKIRKLRWRQTRQAGPPLTDAARPMVLAGAESASNRTARIGKFSAFIKPHFAPRA
jgi:hypothetical protein